MTLQRHSSRRRPLDASFLTSRLAGARSYDRIVGYFSSSILEVAGEAFEQVHGGARIVCNSHLSRADVEIAKAAQAAMRREWCESRPEALGDAAKPRFRRLYDGLRSSKLSARVLPDEVFGLIHGKAGVITLADGRPTSFLRSDSTNTAQNPWIHWGFCQDAPGPPTIPPTRERRPRPGVVVTGGACGPGGSRQNRTLRRCDTSPQAKQLRLVETLFVRPCVNHQGDAHGRKQLPHVTVDVLHDGGFYREIDGPAGLVESAHGPRL